MTERPRRKLSEMLRAHLPLAGGAILDVGCGDGGLVRFLTREGARVVGLEPSAGQLARARAAEPAGGERYVRGVAEALPFAAVGFDAVVFSNSLHHVPVPQQAAALAEAGRVLRDGGLLYALEPLAEGPYFELMQPVEDETEVRARAWEALQAAEQGPVLSPKAELCFVSASKYRDFETLADQVLAVDPRRAATLKALDAHLRARFEALSEWRDGAAFLDQPYRLTLLSRRP